MTTNNPVAIITGAGTGIGRQTAFALWKQGYSIVLAGRRLEPLEQTVADANVSSEQALVVSTDVADKASVQNLFTQAREKYERLDLLFNNAGVSPPATAIEDVSMELWNTIINVNLTGTFLCTQEAMRWMKAQDPQGGRIINNGSLSAQAPRPHTAPYVAAKHAINGLTKSTILEGRPFNIACGQIDIGNASTVMTTKMGEGVLQADGEKRVEPTMDADNVANAVVYMASLPLDTNVPFITVMASQMPFFGRG